MSDNALVERVQVAMHGASEGEARLLIGTILATYQLRVPSRLTVTVWWC